MTTIHNLGFPRIGKKRQLKFALEKYWQGKITQEELQNIAADLRKQNWQLQSHLDYVPVGDFSLYDQVLDMSFLLGNIPRRAQDHTASPLDQYFNVARGRSQVQECQCSQPGNSIYAAEMTKWFDSNYHYIVPELDAQTEFKLNSESLLQQLQEASQLGLNPKPVLIGPVTYLWLSKSRDQSNPLDFLDSLINIYGQLLNQLHKAGVKWVQMDEPILVTDLDSNWQHAIRKTYYQLQSSSVKILLTTYFGQLKENLQLVCSLPINGIHIDAINAAKEVPQLVDWLPSNKILSLGVINGRNIWKTNLEQCLDWLEPIYARLKERLWLAPSSSLLHVPVDLDSETHLDSEISDWLAFAVQKLDELHILSQALNLGRSSVAQALAKNSTALQQRKNSQRVHNISVKAQLEQLEQSRHDRAWTDRQSPYSQRAKIQQATLSLPPFPTTTIGSFPQTQKIRKLRNAYRKKQLSLHEYQEGIKSEIKSCVLEQEQLGLDVLVHGEAERNDMVEYFGEQLEGFITTENAWVQSYGSRCVKPPIIFGDISRPQSMTVDWIKYAQSLTAKPIKGMLTGPVTILNWSFVRDDQPRHLTTFQLALAIRQEVLDLEQAGISIIQIDEAALREGLPLRQNQWKSYLNHSIRAFRICANGVRDETQIHTHMCYSEFNDIIQAIAEMDADVITIETSRSQMELLEAFKQFQYPNEIGPGVYDIHSPNIPSVESIINLMKKAAERIPASRLWVNPDCGLKTRQWEEVRPALKNMVTASRKLAESFQ